MNTNLMPFAAVLLSLGACSPKKESQAAELIFPLFAECVSDVKAFEKDLERGAPQNSLAIDTFPLRIESHLSLVGVVRARMSTDPLLRVPPEEYLQFSASAVLMSCMPNLGTRLELPGLAAQVERALPSASYDPERTYYAEVKGNQLSIYFNDGSYSYTSSMNLGNN